MNHFDFLDPLYLKLLKNIHHSHSCDSELVANMTLLLMCLSDLLLDLLWGSLLGILLDKVLDQMLGHL